MLEVLSQDYIRTARAKGLPENIVIYKHAFRNSLFPIITVFANIFPYVISGSVILEFIFSIPGMGTETINAIDEKNYPMIIAVFTLTGFLTLIGYLISDILYAYTDPRISYSKWFMTEDKYFTYKSYGWKQFRKNKPAYISFYILIILIIIALLSPIQIGRAHVWTPVT